MNQFKPTTVARPEIRRGGQVTSGRLSKRASSLRTTLRRKRTTRAAGNYAGRVMAKEFEPTAIRAREVAKSRRTTLHELAQELGYASAPPKVRSTPDLTTLTRTELSALTGYSLSDLHRFFARKHPPTLTKLAKVASAYGSWMDDLLTAVGW